MSPNAIPMAKEKGQQLTRRGALHALLPIAVAVVSLVSLLALVQISGVTTSAYDVRRLEQERAGWQQANYQLEAEIARLQSLDRIEKEAKGKQQMVPASEYQFVVVKEIPAPVSGKFAPPSHLKRTDIRRDDDGLSQRLLDWLGSALGFRQR